MLNTVFCESYISKISLKTLGNLTSAKVNPVCAIQHERCSLVILKSSIFHKS